MRYVVCPIAVPFFFVASGYFLGVRAWSGCGWGGNAMRKRIKTLLIPYFFWCVCWCMFTYLTDGILHGFDGGGYLKPLL